MKKTGLLRRLLHRVHWFPNRTLRPRRSHFLAPAPARRWTAVDCGWTSAIDPLTARVTANRMWLNFWSGTRQTTEDSEYRTAYHSELLDGAPWISANGGTLSVSTNVVYRRLIANPSEPSAVLEFDRRTVSRRRPSFSHDGECFATGGWPAAARRKIAPKREPYQQLVFGRGIIR